MQCCKRLNRGFGSIMFYLFSVRLHPTRTNDHRSSSFLDKNPTSDPRGFVVDVLEGHGLIHIETIAVRVPLPNRHEGAARNFASLATHASRPSPAKPVGKEGNSREGVAPGLRLPGEALNLGKPETHQTWGWLECQP